MGKNSSAHAEGYPGRALPKSEEVKTAVSKPGAAIASIRKQTEENRVYLNKHVEEKQGE
jgi:hypothetical protein